jgi:opacity protein-like surface antigen
VQDVSSRILVPTNQQVNPRNNQVRWRYSQWAVSITTLRRLCIAKAHSDHSCGTCSCCYSYLRAGSGTLDVNSINTNGWAASLTGNFNRLLGVTAEFSSQYKNEISGVTVNGRDYNILFGPQIGYRTGKLRPFAHALFGVSRLTADGISSQNSFAMAYGGGLDVKANRLLSIRLGQLDYLRTQFFDDSQNHFRYTAGVVLNLGGK